MAVAAAVVIPPVTTTTVTTMAATASAVATAATAASVAVLAPANADGSAAKPNGAAATEGRRGAERFVDVVSENGCSSARRSPTGALARLLKFGVVMHLSLYS